MPKTYVISDLHGRHDLLLKALDAIKEQAPHAGSHTIITTGDYIDRGLESYDVIKTLKTFHSDRFVMINLMGNHETFLVDAVKYGTGADFWCEYNGGTATMFSYGAKAGEYFNSSLIPWDHVEWVEKLPLYYEDKHRVYVHARVYDGRALEDTPKQNLIWDYYEDEPGGWNGKYVVHGHRPFEDGPKEWAMRVDLDTAAYYTGRLVVGVFDYDKPGGLESTITVTGPTLKQLLANRV